MNIIQTIHSRRGFRAFFNDLKTWRSWETYLQALFGLEKPSQAQFRVFQDSTGLRQWPGNAFKESYVVCGRRGGKSTIVSVIAVFLALFRDWSDVLSKGEKGYIFVIAVNKSQGKIIKDKIETLLELQPHFKRLVRKVLQDEIELTNNIVISIKPASFRSTRGYTLLCVICEELSFWRYEEAAIPDVEIIRALRPALVKDGLLIGISSPWAQSGFLYEQFKKYYGKNSGPLIWHSPTECMNPAFDKEKIKEAYSEDPVSARTEYGGAFRKDTSDYIDPAVIDACVIPQRYGLDYRRGVVYHAFIDPSGARSDSFTLAIAHREKKKTVLDCAMEYIPPFRPENVIEDYCGIIQRYRLRTATSDRYAGELITSPFRNFGIEIEPSSRTKSEIFAELLPLLLNGKVELLDNARLTTQLKALDRKTRQAGKDVIMNFHGHDDLANSAAGAIVNAAAAIDDWPLSKLWISCRRLTKEDRFDNLSPEDQEQVEMYKSHKWLLDDKPKKKDKEGFERTVIEDDSTD